MDNKSSENSLQFYSKHGQDKYLYEEIFKNNSNGIFVDFGAYDGIESSNSYFFEKELGWDGICVEPLPQIFIKLQSNRKCLCINKCISDNYKNGEFLHVIPENPPGTIIGNKRVSNIEKMSGLVEFYNNQHKKLIDSRLNELGGRKETFEVECIPADDVLKLLPSKKIDYLTIDTEGSELHILKSIDFNLFEIDVIVLEVLYSSEELSAFMDKHRYKLINKIGYDWIYRKI